MDNIKFTDEQKERIAREIILHFLSQTEEHFKTADADTIADAAVALHDATNEAVNQFCNADFVKKIQMQLIANI